MSPLLILLFSPFILLSPVISYTALDKLIYEDLEVVNEQGQGQVVNEQGRQGQLMFFCMKRMLPYS